MQRKQYDLWKIICRFRTTSLTLKIRLVELLVVTLLVIIIVLLFQKQKIRKEKALEKLNLDKIIVKNNAVILDQSRRIELLSKYEDIVDVEKEISVKRAESNRLFAMMKQEATDYVKLEREKGKKIREAAEQKIEEAHEISTMVISDAKVKAAEIAGDAYYAKENADQFKETAKAMKNIIDGYGDEYLIPGESLLDELAEDYNHTEAGKDLANIRTLVKSMIKNGLVADCNYVELQRRSAAIDFVIDAFNGKVDTIMSKVKHDNFGILLQKLKDAYRIVNHNGQPFKNARILPKFYDVIEDQLKLAVIVSELKKKDREEQRAIREEMREEARAKREYEKALKQSQKEEKLIAKALKEAEAKYKEATVEERIKFQSQLEKLKVDLEEAILKGQRALSMAQQTKIGHVYVISNIGSFGENIFKIGLTRRLEPMDRIKELGDASVPFAFDVHAMIHSDNAPALERELQSHFKQHQVNKINPRKEFFNLSLGEIKNKVESMDLNTHWTMKAEAMEYRESLQLNLD